MFGVFNFIFESVPINRTTYCAFVLLRSKGKKDKQGNPIAGPIKGTYVQGFYQLAKEQSLHCQIIDKWRCDNNKPLEWFKDHHPKLFKQMYKRNAQDTGWVQKNAFELAIVPEVNVSTVLDRIKDEYDYQNEHGLLPQPVFKVQMMQEWLAGLGAAGLEKAGPAQGAAIMVDNPEGEHKKNEKWLHALMQILGILVTSKSLLSFITGVTAFFAFSVTTPLAILATVLGSYFALDMLHLGDMFSYHDVAEALWTDVRWLMSKHFTQSSSPFGNAFDSKYGYQGGQSTDKSSISILKLMRSLAFMAVITAFAVFCAQGTFWGVLALSTPYVGASLALGLSLVLGALSFLTTCLGSSVPVRYMVGFGIWNNTISPRYMRDAHLPDLPKNRLPQIKPNTGVKAPRREDRRDEKLHKQREENYSLSAQLSEKATQIDELTSQIKQLSLENGSLRAQIQEPDQMPPLVFMDNDGSTQPKDRNQSGMGIGFEGINYTNSLETTPEPLLVLSTNTNNLEDGETTGKKSLGG